MNYFQRKKLQAEAKRLQRNSGLDLAAGAFDTTLMSFMEALEEGERIPLNYISTLDLKAIVSTYGDDVRISINEMGIFDKKDDLYVYLDL